tara:strand:+ start:5537 stop:7156 length:1620 start_codon:yes stop_codon:yes gene_type:complete
MGANGSGKSTLLDALCFVLFNKAFRKITKGQLVNSTNEKDSLVEIEFEAAGYQWKIRRGIKPAIFEIYKNGVVMDQLASAADQQNWLEKNVLKLNYKSFTQIVILGSASFVPFMQLSTAHRREIVEDLLDIKVFSSMNTLLKEKLKLLRDKQKDIEVKRESTFEKIEMQERFIKTLETNTALEIEEKSDRIKILGELIDEKRVLIGQIQQTLINEYQPKLDEVSNATNKIRKLENLRVKLEEKVSTETELVEFFENNSVCPTCTQTIEDGFRLNKVGDHHNTILELTDGLKDMQKALQKEDERQSKFIQLSKEITKLNNDVSNHNLEVGQYEKRKGELELEVQRLIGKNENKSVEQSVLAKLEKQLNKLDLDRSKYRELHSYYAFTQTLLKDGGVKAKIIQKYLPLMNQQINKYLQMMDFYINFTLDDEFNENIKSAVHEDFSYASFSEGEKMRINLALLFTWREIARMKNSVRTNLLILDEVFDSSLDGAGIDYFSKIIRYTIKDANIVVISHKTDELIDMFQKVIKVEKVKGFSKLT